jgi:hypothetical protein
MCSMMVVFHLLLHHCRQHKAFQYIQSRHRIPKLADWTEVIFEGVNVRKEFLVTDRYAEKPSRPRNIS